MASHTCSNDLLMMISIVFNDELGLLVELARRFRVEDLLKRLRGSSFFRVLVAGVVLNVEVLEALRQVGENVW